MIKGGKISAEVLKKALDKFVQEIETVSYTHLDVYKRQELRFPTGNVMQ